MNTLIVNLLAGPGAGKSTFAAALFAELKFYGTDVELAPEYAKDLVWEKRHKTFEDQIYMFGKQYHRINRLIGQVEVIVTDSPILLTPIYDGLKRKTLEKLVLEEFNKNRNYNIFLNRKKKYVEKGRNETEEQAKEVDKRIKKFLNDNDISYQELDGTKEHVKHAARVVFEKIGVSNTF